MALRTHSPFRLDLTVWALRRRGRNRLDRWDGTYRRALDLGERAVTVQVTQRARPGGPCLDVAVLTPGERTAGDSASIEQQLVRMLGLDVDLGAFYGLADGDARVGLLADRLRGVKPPRFPSLFEAFVNAIANQQLSLEVGIELLNRFTEAFGRRPADAHGLVAFPAPEAVLGGSIDTLRGLGFSTRKAEYLMSCADAVVTGEIDEASLGSSPRAEATRLLTELHGIGRWSAEYVLLRGLGRIDVFPADDVGARNKLQRFFELPAPPDREQILSLLEPFAPVAGMIYFHLLLDGLDERGELDV
ncbi:MAG: DNA-3-methyladenine glycosylase family protein [Microthrixaceae bacterium]